MDDTDFYKQASEEFDSNRDEALYIKAQTTVNGDESKVRFAYIKLRVEQLSATKEGINSGVELGQNLIQKFLNNELVKNALNTDPTRRNPIQWFLYCLSRYTEFDGRASRSEFWSWIGACFIILFLSMMLDALLGSYSPDVGLGLISTIVGLLLIVPNFAVTVRRLHDLGRPGYFSLALLMPIVNWMLLLYMLWPSVPHANQYGAPSI